MKIPDSLLPVTYEVCQAVYKKDLRMTDGVTLLSEKGMNVSSARDYIYIFKYLMDGKRFTRTLNASSFDYFLTKIKNEYPSNYLANGVSALGLHIEYYESLGNGKLLKVRGVYDKFAAAAVSHPLISDKEDLINNLRVVEQYLVNGSESEKAEMGGYIQRGICFVAYEVDGEIGFAPSKFIGYLNNNLISHIPNEKDGRITKRVVSELLKGQPIFDDNLDRKYQDYCRRIGIIPKENGSYGVTRKYWRLTLKGPLQTDPPEFDGFPEGRMVERIHKARERSLELMQLAKAMFKQKYGRVFCEACGFDYEEVYGNLGKDFIEGHHIIPVSEMEPNYKTKPEEIVMLCSNCHKMVHKKRPWLKVDDLKKLLLVTDPLQKKSEVH